MASRVGYALEYHNPHNIVTPPNRHWMAIFRRSRTMKDRPDSTNLGTCASEDFRPFNVDVTTQDPGVEALRNTSAMA